MSVEDAAPLFDTSICNVEHEETQQAFVVDEFLTCIQLYRRILSKMGGTSGILSQIKQARVTRALEEYGRLRMWGEQTRAVLQPDARGSLDNTLREDELLKDAAMSMLRSLYTHLEMMATTLEYIQARSSDPSGDIMSDSGSSEVTSSSEEEDPDDEFDKGRVPAQPKIGALLDALSENIDTLFRFSKLLDRPGLHRRYIHSTGKTEFDPRVAHFEEYDLNHVKEKLLFWSKDQKRLEDDEVEVSPETLGIRRTTALFPSRDIERLIERLAKANTKRREQLLYWKRHPDVSPISLVLPETVEASQPRDQPLAVLRPTVIDVARAPEIEAGETASQAPPSTMTRKTFSHVAVSERFESQSTTGPPRTIYAESTVGRRSATRAPDLPKGALDNAHFDCPYCQTQLDSLKMSNRLNWKRHVFRDLRPYICTFSDCQNPDKQYPTRHDWVLHEQQIHRRQWVCEEHEHAKFRTKEFFEIHFSEYHSEFSEQHQFPILVEVSERPSDEDEIVPCPLCPDELYLKTLRTHLAEHLEEIALFVLPLSVEESDDTDSKRATGEAPASVIEEKSEESIETSPEPEHGSQPSKYEDEAAISVDSRKEHTAEFEPLSQTMAEATPPHQHQGNGPLGLLGVSEPEEIIPGDVVIAVMGVTGAGKTTFVNYLADQEQPIGHGLGSCTLNVNVVPCTLPDGKRIYLADTPGFDNTYRSDAEILREVASWLIAAYEMNIKLTGIIYLHPILDVAVGGAGVQNLRIFQKLCGDDGLGSVVFATTMWSFIQDEEIGKRHEDQLKSENMFLMNMIQKGSVVFRQDKGRESAQEIVNYLIEKGRPVTLDIQREMVDRRMCLNETGAGAEVEWAVEQAKRKYEQKLKELKETSVKLEGAIARKDDDLK